MPKNSYFNSTNAVNEQKLIDSLIAESIQIMGENVIYLPQQLIALDNFFLEDSLTKYPENYIIEMYQEVEDYGFGNTDFFNKFGIQTKDRTTYIVSKTTFDRLITDNNVTASRPLEGDLIYNIVSSELFKITHVENENPYRQFGGVFQYKLNCEIYKYSHQRISTDDYGLDIKINNVSSELKIYLKTPITGDFIINETITSGTTTAKITDWNAVERTITVIDRNGTFTENASLVGQSSGIIGVISTFKTSDDNNQVLDINELLQNVGTTLIADKKNNITGTIATNDFMSSF